MFKWIVILALIMLAPIYVKTAFGTGVDFVSTQGRALVGEVVKEATKTINEAK